MRNNRTELRHNRCTVLPQSRRRHCSPLHHVRHDLSVHQEPRQYQRHFPSLSHKQSATEKSTRQGSHPPRHHAGVRTKPAFPGNMCPLFLFGEDMPSFSAVHDQELRAPARKGRMQNRNIRPDARCESGVRPRGGRRLKHKASEQIFAGMPFSCIPAMRRRLSGSTCMSRKVWRT